MNEMEMKNEGSLLSIKRIYYRGKLNSCNYTCSYCPFGKKSHLTATTQDEQAWNRFITAIEQWQGGPLQLFIIPYGEALIHRYYRKGIIHLAALPQVAGISCQTNLSFSADEWLDEFPATPTLISKIKIWASFHPEMTSVESFVRRLHTLYNAGIQVCAGAVGNPMAKSVLSDLRNALLPDIYLFINAMQGLKSPLSIEDIRFFTQLDNLFEYDLKNASAQTTNPAKADAKAMEAERQKLRAKINDLGRMNEEKRKTVKSDHKASDFKVGDTVHVISMDSEGTIMALADSKGKLKVQMGIISAALPPTDLLLVEHEKKKPQKATVTGGKSMNRMMNIKPEINVLGMTVDEATSLVDRFLDDALMAHLHRVTIIHGKGTGALRKGIHQFLKSQPHVKSFRLGEFGEGDAGVTIVEL